MRIALKSTTAAAAIGALAMAAPTGLSAQQYDEGYSEQVVVTGTVPGDIYDLPEGPKIEGMISARKDDRIRVSTEDGGYTDMYVGDVTLIRSSGGFLGLDKDRLSTADLLNGVPVEVETRQWGSRLVAEKIAMKRSDMKTAAMIRSGTEQGFAEQTAATDALRTRVGDIDEYNIKGTTNVYFDTGKYSLSNEARMELCQAAQQAEATDNALLLVVGYTDSTGNYEINQELSEKRASRVVNFLQQECGWKPYRMLTPTGMAMADPVAPNTTPDNMAQNRRVAVNILVSKSVDGL